MSYEELDRVRVIERVIEKRLTQVEAARILGLTTRQVRRLRRAHERDGARALASKQRGRPSNRRRPPHGAPPSRSARASSWPSSSGARRITTWPVRSRRSSPGCKAGASGASGPSSEGAASRAANPRAASS
jgi:transposase-like protein